MNEDKQACSADGGGVAVQQISGEAFGMLLTLNRCNKKREAMASRFGFFSG